MGISFPIYLEICLLEKNFSIETGAVENLVGTVFFFTAEQKMLWSF